MKFRWLITAFTVFLFSALSSVAYANSELFAALKAKGISYKIDHREKNFTALSYKQNVGMKGRTVSISVTISDDDVTFFCERKLNAGDDNDTVVRCIAANALNVQTALTPAKFVYQEDKDRLCAIFVCWNKKGDKGSRQEYKMAIDAMHDCAGGMFDLSL